jgi:hypothetical protein
VKLTLRRVGDGYRKVGAFTRATVAKRVTYLAGGGIILGELVRDGIVPAGLADGITHWATVAFSVLGVAAGVLWAHAGATPADPQLLPKDKYGNRLVSALDVGPHAGLSTEPDGLAPDAGAATAAATALAAAAEINPQPSPPPPA